MTIKTTSKLTPLALKLRAALHAKGMRQADVIREFPEVSSATVGHWFSGKRQPQLDNLRKLAAILDVSAAALVADDVDYATNKEERLALVLLRGLTPDMRQAVLALMQAQTPSK